MNLTYNHYSQWRCWKSWAPPPPGQGWGPFDKGRARRLLGGNNSQLQNRYLHLEAHDNMTSNWLLVYATAQSVFAREHQNCHPGLQTDESSTSLSTFDGCESLRTLCRGEHYEFCSILQHDWTSESVMFWGGLVRGDLPAVRFQDERLIPITRLHAGPVGLGFYLVHDNARLDVCQQFLDDEDATDWLKHS